MPTISDDEYAEFEYLRRHYQRERVRQSAAALTLEQDIDAPIKKCVMALALLGCEPMWSCCGFDYDGQPLHKSHQYGSTGFALRDNPHTRFAMERLAAAGLSFQGYANAWRVRYQAGHYGDDKCYLNADIETKNTWPDKDSIHYSEPAVIAIQILEDYLLSQSSLFVDRVSLTDTNVEFQQRFHWWQYPTKAPWIIRKTDLVPEMELA
jgi:hypothetical protein